MAQRLIIDTDPGVDDMVAILAALHCQDVELAALTTVGGNVPLGQTTRNALRVLARAGRLEVPVYAGLTVPHSATEVHGDDGLAGCPWPDASTGAQEEPAVSFLTRRLETGGVTLACLGPLTNLAAVLRARPELVAGLDRVVLMGGGFGTYSFQARNGPVVSSGNITADAEFNIYSDVDAARVVLGSGAPVTVVPLDISHRTLVSGARLERLDAQLAGMLDRYAGFSRKRWGHDAGPLHDPNVIARIAEPDLYRGLRGMVRVGDEGRTEWEPGAGPHEVLFHVDAEGYLDWVWEQLAAGGF